MGYKSLAECIRDLERTGRLKRISREVDPYLEMADIHLETHAKGGPALLFERVKGSPFPAVSNLFGTFERTEYIFRNEIPRVRAFLRLRSAPQVVLRHPWRYRHILRTALTALPKRQYRRPPVLSGRTTLSRLPQIVSWPQDGGAFITLPQVLTLPPGVRNILQANIGMYRIQISGNDYIPDKEAGLHYQLHRGIGIHHQLYNETEEDFRVSIFIGGPPAHTFAAIMPLPETVSEVTIAGMLNSRRFRYFMKDGYVLSADADFVITGIVKKGELKPEGPFGDHLGYYSLRHDFPVLKVTGVYHRRDAIWPFTVVGRPPQEDSSFGHLIHLLTADVVQQEFPGIREVHAVDEAGVHPLLLAIGSERYMPFERLGRHHQAERPEEILTQAFHLLGKGQTSLAKFLIIADGTPYPGLRTKDIKAFFGHVLSRIRWQRDLHFITHTTMDTLDYSGDSWNGGSKLIMACAGTPVRRPATMRPATLPLPEGFTGYEVVLPGILAVTGPAYRDRRTGRQQMRRLAMALPAGLVESFPLIVVTDDCHYLAASLANFLWVSFTRADPAQDIYGVNDFVLDKHWGCEGPLLLDARAKPHHAPALIRSTD